MNDGLDELRQRYPSWTIEAEWVPRASAGDYRRLRAQYNGVTVTAYDAATLGARMLDVERSARKS